MNRKNIEKMLEGIDDRYIAEALSDHAKSGNRSKKKTITKILAAASICFCVAGLSVSVLATTNSNLWKRINLFQAKDVKIEHSRGVTITKERKKTQENLPETEEPATASRKYYLVLNYLPKGYQCEGDDTCLYYGPKGDTDFITIAFFHLQSDFTNVLPQADKIDKYETTEGTAYVASSKRTNRLWILFNKGSYMMELRDDNKMLSKKEICKIIEGADLSEKKPAVVYETLEWTEKLQESYKAWLKKYAE